MKFFPVAFAIAILVTVPSTKIAYSPRNYIAQYKLEMRQILQKDLELAPTDFSLWPEVALATRKLSVRYGVKVANGAIDDVFRSASSKKLYSHVWSVLPSASILGMGEHQYRATLDIFKTEAEYPLIRRNLLAFIASEPDDPFVEFGYYALGDFKKGLSVRPKSEISDLLHYAIGFDTLKTIIKDAYDYAVTHAEQKIRIPPKSYIVRNMQFINQNPQLFDNKPLVILLPQFAERAALVKLHFENVLSNPKSPMADDAAYFLGWLAFHQEQYDAAAMYFALGMTVGNGDYALSGSVRQMGRVFERYPPNRQYEMLKSNKILVKQSPLWYVAARSAYRNYDYRLSSAIVQEALSRYNISIDTLPVSTNPQRIEATLARYKDVREDWTANMHAGEMLYLYAACQEFQRYLSYLESINQDTPEQALVRVKAIITKYSQTVDLPYDESGTRPSAHKDFRQAVHLIDVTLQKLPRDQKFLILREWLHYRKVKILALFAPKTVGQAVALMENDVPESSLNNNALAEQIYAEAFVAGDMAAARVSFDRLLSKYPNGNAVDNAHSWMAIGYRCAEQISQSHAIDREIIKRFPWTRHARYARSRLSDTNTKSGRGCYYRRGELDDDDQALTEPTSTPFKTFDNVDVLGYDINVLKQTAPDECSLACRDNRNCSVYSYDKWNKMCFLKEINGDFEFVVDARSVTGLREYISVPDFSTNPTVIQHLRNRGFPGYNVTPNQVATFEVCESHCVNASWCVAFTFVKSSRKCFMFKTTGEYFSNTDTDSGAKVTAD
jgi:PAN domain